MLGDLVLKELMERLPRWFVARKATHRDLGALVSKCCRLN
jgi:hypothetical protein